ncbi:MAG: DUF4864 domain-containing protein [Limimaricola soesokkakensis]|uniref:Uncharacterized protein DUF4864 n=1 Tax=Limimaricola soesokkakensis TaxID=1343159 RepID=A0A1X6YU38_9RHOB|nr:DUF4864 domain-containing protein [Limimaricola soesokkakensis]PSK87588.1 uncharacterized protein DUF4864 [Limimaricola soesokkakensis]SLN31554.1 hypothetical protein LOS8367_01152 [Limimaricola soesokkakensis]
MRMGWAALALFGTLTVAAVAQQASEMTIPEVIGDQLSDFTARDLDGAFAHASEMIQRLFDNPENFGRMVEQGYPMVWDNDSARFMSLREESDASFQTVLIRDARGVPHLLEYRMIETPQGWRIDGVTLLAAPGLGV